MSQVFRTSFLLAVCLVLCQCWGSSKTEEPKATELVPPEANRIDAPQDSLFQEGKRLYSSGLHKVAKDSFVSLKNSYPIGPYAEFAEIKAADSEFELREYASAALLYEDFVKNHPGSEATPYMLLQAGLSHLFSSRGVGRDITTLEKSHEHLSKLIELYPGSPYFDTAKRYKLEIEQKMAESEALVRDFYKKQNKTKAYEARQRYYDEKWGNILERNEGTDTTKVAASSSTVAANPIGSPPLIRAMARVPTKERASLQSSRVAAGVPASVSSSEEIDQQANPLEARTAYRIHKVDCKDGTQKMVLFYLNKEFQELSFIEKHRKVPSQDGRITLSLPDTSFADTSAISNSDDCFGSADLKLQEAGRVSLDAAGSATLMTLSNPPRLALVLSE